MEAVVPLEDVSEGKGGMAGVAEEGAAVAVPLSGKGGKAGAEPLGAVVVAWFPPGISGRGGMSCPIAQPAVNRKSAETKNRFNILQLLALAGEKVIYFKLISIPRR
jgi:hypothetical protein